MFFSSLKLPYCRTIVLVNKLLKHFKTPFFQKRRWSCDFPPRKTPVAQKMAFSIPRRVVLGSPPPPPESVRAYGRTLTSQPKFLGSIGYQICLARVLRYKLFILCADDVVLLSHNAAGLQGNLNIFQR